MLVKSKYRWQTYVLMSLVLLGVIAVGDSHLFNRTRIAQNGSVSSTAPHVTGQADSAPTDKMIRQMTEQLGNVSGLYDMVVLPDGLNDGKYLVSAMVNTSDMTSSDKSQLNADVDAFFKGIYSNSEPVSMAELTMTTEGGQIIGTAGLGKAAYQSLATSTMSSDLATSLMEGPVIDNDTPQEAWYQVQTS